MKAEIKQRWLKALRDGDYEQGEGALRQQHAEDEKPQYCCLGVLCDLHRQSTKRTGWSEGGSESDDNFSYFEEDCFLPEAVTSWAGISGDVLAADGDINVNYRGNATKLSILNDGSPGEHRRLTFKEIANVIENQL
jgi:hypothetical protein